MRWDTGSEHWSSDRPECVPLTAAVPRTTAARTAIATSNQRNLPTMLNLSVRMVIVARGRVLRDGNASV